VTPVARRRALGLLALAALIAGVVAGASGGGGGGSSPSDPLAIPRADVAAAKKLPLDRATGLLVLIRFRGTTTPGYVLRALHAERAGGVILFTDNITGRGQLRALTRSLQRAAGGHALVATDQEGGEVRRLPWAAPHASQPEQDARGTVAAEAAQGARDLRAEGIDVVLAPVADVPDAPSSAMAGRGFSQDPIETASAVRASVRAWLAGGVLPTLKHFPGLGAAHANTDQAPVTVTTPVELEPFRAGIAAGAPLVMASHALYPQLDPAHIASQSPAILTGLLRRRLRFGGVIVTDSLEAKAVTSRSSVGTAAVRSIAAGADLALTTGRGSFLPVLRALRARARRDPAFAARVRESAARVLALRARAAP
jgi:beta-N-acetylhexosaminidase